jgi:predicted nucleotidyltransferase
MPFRRVVPKLNELKKMGLIGDYAICGGYAVMFHGSSFETYDLDVVVVMPGDRIDLLHDLYEHFSKIKARIEKEHVYIEGMPVQFFPASIDPLYQHAVENAILVEYDVGTTKFVSLEHLILLLLTAFRQKDKIRIKELLSGANKKIIKDLIEKFDGKQKLQKRYEEILGKPKRLKKST